LTVAGQGKFLNKGFPLGQMLCDKAAGDRALMRLCFSLAKPRDVIIHPKVVMSQKTLIIRARLENAPLMPIVRM
jgi:hypothetical protein